MDAHETVTARDTRRPAPWLVWTLGLTAGAVGLVYGFRVGQQVAGLWLGLVMALNAGVLCALVAGSATDRLLRWLARIGNRP